MKRDKARGEKPAPRVPEIEKIHEGDLRRWCASRRDKSVCAARSARTVPTTAAQRKQHATQGAGKGGTGFEQVQSRPRVMPLQEENETF